MVTSSFLRVRWSSLILWASFFLLVFSSRLIVYNHYATDAPFSDDWQIAADIVEMRDSPLFGASLFKTHVQHIIVFTRLEQIITAKYNGLWQMRIQNVFHAVPYSIFALITALILNRSLKNNTMAVFGSALMVFAIPWAGDRVLWSLLSGFSWMMLWSVVQVTVISLVDRKQLQLPLSLLVCTLASLSIGAGSLVTLLTACWFTWLTVRGNPSERRMNLLTVILHLALFLFFYSLVPKGAGGMVSDLPTTIKAFLRCLAFPTINLWLLGPVAFLPWTLLAINIAFRKSPPSREETILLLLGCVVIMQSLGIAVFRGENNNGGVPASRYYDILILGPIVNFGIVLRYLAGIPKASFVQNFPALSWILITLSGFLLLFFWRVTPWISMDSGEWEQGLKQAALASWARGEIKRLPDYSDKTAPEMSYHENPDQVISKYVSRENDPRALVTGAMLGGYPLTPTQHSDGFQLDGFPANRKPRPWLRYWGSHDRSGMKDRIRKFESQPVNLTSSHIQFEFLLDKKSRFRFYNLGASSLKLVNLEDQSEIDILRRIPRSFPSIFMDREVVTLKLPKPGNYKIVAEDLEINSGWFAFSEPTACGPLGAVAQTILNSGKLIMFGAILMLVLATLLKRLESGRDSFT